MSTKAKMILFGAVLIMILAMAAGSAFANDGDTFIYLPKLGRHRPEPTICNLPCPRPSYVPPTRFPTKTPIVTATPFLNEPPQPVSVNWSGKGG